MTFLIDLTPPARAARINGAPRALSLLSVAAKSAASPVPHPGVSAADFGVPGTEARETGRDAGGHDVASGTPKDAA